MDQRSVITLVGDGMKHYRGLAARFLSAISAAGVNVEVIAQGSTECAIAVVVRKQSAQAALRAMSYRIFQPHQPHGCHPAGLRKCRFSPVTAVPESGQQSSCRTQGASREGHCRQPQTSGR